MTGRTIALLRDGFPERPAFDTAVSKAMLRLVSQGRLPETLRLYRPGAMVAFGGQDISSPGYLEAVSTARSQGFEAVQRLAGGRAAVYHEETIAFAWTIPGRTLKQSIAERFQEISAITAEALRSLGVDARVGEVNGEYCPGTYSVNARGATKLMGVGQRLDANAAHVGGVIVVSGADRISRVLVPVYEALHIPWDPSTTGSITDEVGSVTYADVEQAVLEAFSQRHTVVPTVVTSEALTLAEELEPEHRSPQFAPA